MPSATSVGVIVIGRNEGPRLSESLNSLLCSTLTPTVVVYVDSRSTDDSVQVARRNGVLVHELLDGPLSAARARNEGAKLALQTHPELELLQFIDGDCMLRPTWLANASAFLAANASVAAVAGRRREKFPERSPYNTLADLEWDTPIGPTIEVGGDVLVRSRSFTDCGGYDPTLIAGEDPEFCLRLTRAGGQLVRLDEEMTLHDADMLHFSQWWKRNVRAGHAYAESAHRYQDSPERFRHKELRSILFWGAAVPTGSVALVPVTFGASAVAGAALAAVLAKRIYSHRRERSDSPQTAALYAGAVTIGKLAEMQGVLQYGWNRFVRNQNSSLIEYKTHK